MKKIINKIAQNLLLYITIIISMLYVCGIDSLAEMGWDVLLIATCIVGALVELCIAFVRKENIWFIDKFDE